jgi:hypothetical protein
VDGLGAGAGFGAGAGAGLAGAGLGAVLGRVIVGNCGPGFCHGSIFGAGVPGFNGSIFGGAVAGLGATLGAVLVAAFVTALVAAFVATFVTPCVTAFVAATLPTAPAAAIKIGISGATMITSYPYCVVDDSKCQLIVRKHCIFHMLVLDRQTAQCAHI